MNDRTSLYMVKFLGFAATAAAVADSDAEPMMLRWYCLLYRFCV